MDYKLVAELRPTIGSCQFFVKWNKQIDASEVLITSNKIFIKGGKNDDITVINVGTIRIAEGSISGLHVTPTSVQFRIRIEPKSVYGSFKFEMIVKEMDLESNKENYVPKIVAGEEVVIRCRHCSTPFAQQPFIFRRILPLPTTFDVSDFFCHGNPNLDVKPRPEDCLYGLYFIQINATLSNLDNYSNHIIVCQNCSEWLGVKKEHSILFWNSSVKFKEQDNLCNTNVAFSDFISTVKHLINKDNGATSKIILYSKVENNITYYLLIWVIEKSLSLLINKENMGVETLLKEQKVSKVLYTGETELTETVKKWENDMTSLQMQISKQMMTEGLGHLKEMSENIPEEFRKANQMDVSYIVI